MIAHRKNTLINCDRIIQLENGKIINEGKPKDIIKSFINQDLLLNSINNEIIN